MGASQSDRADRGVAAQRLAIGRRWASSRRSAATKWLNRKQPFALRSACFAPHSALYFRTDGTVNACCATGFTLGSVTGPDRSTIREIWEGAEADLQRQHLQDGRFDLGCQECEAAIVIGGRDASIAGGFDRWRRGSPHHFPQMIDFALSNRCNLQCVMCDGNLSSSIRTKREGRPALEPAYDDAFFEELATFIPHLRRAQFKGGEPFLAPENRRVWDLLIETNPTCETLIVTNGTVWTADVERYVRALGAYVSISIDAMSPDLLESIRVGVDTERLWTNIDRFADVARSMGQQLTLAYCLMANNWHELPDFLSAVDDRNLSCTTILVNQPDEYDLLKLPGTEIDALVADLEARAPKLVGLRPRREWARVMGLLRSPDRGFTEWTTSVPDLDLRPAGVAVEITTRPTD